MMATLRYLVFAGLAVIWPSWLYADVHGGGHPSSGVKQRYLLLDFGNNGQRLAASVGEQIEITLGTATIPGRYAQPQISSAAIRLESTALKAALPGGPVLVYIFEAAAEGEARIQFPFVDAMNAEVANQRTFTVTIQVARCDKNSTTLSETMQPDQANTGLWKNAWMRLNNSVGRQDFVPSLPRLTAVEVELVAATPGVQEGDVSMSVANAVGQALAAESKNVPVSESDHVLFVFPHGGLRVSPGQLYRIGVSSADFGWKYVTDGYSAGAASLNGQPLLANTRSSFLFRTFGTAVTLADPTDPALGTWILNIAKSEFNLGPAPKSEKRTYDSVPDGIKETIQVTEASGSGFSVTSPAYKRDGKPYALPRSLGADAREVTRVGSREYRFTNLIGGKVVGHQTMVVSKDGMVMSITTESGQTLHDVRVFDRQ